MLCTLSYFFACVYGYIIPPFSSFGMIFCKRYFLCPRRSRHGLRGPGSEKIMSMWWQNNGPDAHRPGRCYFADGWIMQRFGRGILTGKGPIVFRQEISQFFHIQFLLASIQVPVKSPWRTTYNSRSVWRTASQKMSFSWSIPPLSFVIFKYLFVFPSDVFIVAHI